MTMDLIFSTGCSFPHHGSQVSFVRNLENRKKSFICTFLICDCTYVRTVSVVRKFQIGGTGRKHKKIFFSIKIINLEKV